MERAGRPRGAKSKRGRAAGRFTKRAPPSEEESHSEPTEAQPPPGGGQQQPDRAGEDDTMYAGNVRQVMKGGDSLSSGISERTGMRQPSTLGG